MTQRTGGSCGSPLNDACECGRDGDAAEGAGGVLLCILMGGKSENSSESFRVGWAELGVGLR